MKRLGGGILRAGGSLGVWGGGGSQGLWSGGRLFFWSFLGQQKPSALCLSWQTHLACNCSDQTDNQSWKCMDKQKFTAAIGKVNRSGIRPGCQQRKCWAGPLVWSVVCVSIKQPAQTAGFQCCWTGGLNLTGRLEFFSGNYCHIIDTVVNIHRDKFELNIWW